MNILGISCYYHDAGACFVSDGSVISAALEERFTRIKHDNNFPEQAIGYCLSCANLKAADIDHVVFYEKPIVKFDRYLRSHFAYFPKSRRIFADTIGSWINVKLQIPKTLKNTIGYTGPVAFVPHHLSHAASSYYLSGFETAAIVTIDGVGEWATTTMGVGRRGKITVEKEIRFPHSLGLLYSAMTAYLGFEVNDAEYKVMGLAAYGDPKPFRKQMNELVRMFPDGSFALDLSYFDYMYGECMFNGKIKTLFGFPARRSESRMERQYENIAASLQEKLEEMVFGLLCAAHARYSIDSLCMAGGVALNSVMNGKILSRTPFKRLFIPPDPGDGGGAMGAAFGFWHLRFPEFKTVQFRKSIQNTVFTPYLGPSFSEEHMEDTLVRHRLTYKRLERKALVDTVAGLIASEHIVGWFQGRMEWGPRALGARSILASATRPEMKDIINSKVKHRELFRPFAPVVLTDYVSEYFRTDRRVPVSAKYMLFVYPFREKGKHDVPAVVHVDGTGRLQTLAREDNPLYFDVVEAYRKKTGIPIIINTSFNVRGEPIVCTPQDAIHCFLKTDIDYLAMGPFIVRKNNP